MFKITKTGILYVLTTIFFVLINIFLCQYNIKTEINEDIMQKQIENVDKKDVEQKETQSNQNSEQIKQTVKDEIWQIEIPGISLIAEIKEGTTKEILNQYVGHFENTSKENGNIGLAGHNRGYDVNYFKDLKLVKQGDEIKYKYNEFEKIYEVEKNRIIKDTDWGYLENTEDNMLTLITCVENQPEYRRCVQAIEKEEEKY